MTYASTQTAVHPPSATLERPEWILVCVVLAIGAVSLALATVKDQAVAWGAFGWSFLPAIGLLLVGLYLRGPKAAPRLGRFAIANAIYVGFSGVIAILIYLRFPIGGPLIDTQLTALDAWFGFDWGGFVTWLGQYPDFGWLLGPVYLSSLPQLFVLIAVLAFAAPAARLHQALLAGTLSLLFTVAFWWVWPSIGPSAFVKIPAEISEAIGLFHNDYMGSKLRSLVTSGTPLIHPGEIMGTIAFPSYHTVMMLVVIWYLRGMTLFWPALALNALMVPAILSHGGHYLLDVFGGGIAFALAAGLAARIAPEIRSPR
jgi:hypothetical protein